MSEHIKNAEDLRHFMLEKGALDDRTDPKWGHPQLRPNHLPMTGNAKRLSDPNLTLEEKEEYQQMVYENTKRMMEQMDDGRYDKDFELKVFMVPGCEEEPDAPLAEMRVALPKAVPEKPMPVIFEIIGGGLEYCNLDMMPAKEVASKNNAIVVVPSFRTHVQAPYPAAINDLHACYKWVYEHAEELHADPDNMMITGMSTGGHLSLCLAFRLKRYGYQPRGAVVCIPQTDDRMTKPSSRLYVGDCDWDAYNTRFSSMAWRGSEFASTCYGPEAYANYATVEDCRGLCPVVISTVEFDSDRDYNREFAEKLNQAGVYVEYHLWAGASHCFTQTPNAATAPHFQLLLDVHNAAVTDCITYDLRRPWTAKKDD